MEIAEEKNIPVAVGNILSSDTFYPDCEIANTTVMARIGDEDFKATGKQIIDPAWRVVFGNNTDKQNEENVLPVYEKGEHGPHTPEIQEKQTQPPKYYTEADLLRAMETAGKQVEDEEPLPLW